MQGSGPKEEHSQVAPGSEAPGIEGRGQGCIGWEGAPRARLGYLQNFLAHIDNSEPVAQLREALKFGVALLECHLLLAGQLPAEVFHQLALWGRRHGSVACSRGQRSTFPLPYWKGCTRYPVSTANYGIHSNGHPSPAGKGGQWVPMRGPNDSTPIRFSPADIISPYLLRQVA